jgi:putative proteasome-type protease
MTYCVAFLLEKGLVFASDSRTNAGVDYISTYSKMHVFQPAPDRLFVLMAAGNLGTTQAVLNRIRRDLAAAAVQDGTTEQGTTEQGASERGTAATTNEGTPKRPDLRSARYLFEVADYIGHLSVAVQRQFATSLREAGATGEASFILGGQIAGEPHGLYLIYPQGNAVMATAETPFLQIGESKYGKPPLDYVGHPGLSLEDGARLCLVSQIITRRSNLTVGPPFEIALVPAGDLRVSRRMKLDKDAPEVIRAMEVWATTMRESVQRLPRFSWEQDPL